MVQAEFVIRNLHFDGNTFFFQNFLKSREFWKIIAEKSNKNRFFEESEGLFQNSWWQFSKNFVNKNAIKSFWWGAQKLWELAPCNISVGHVISFWNSFFFFVSSKVMSCISFTHSVSDFLDEKLGSPIEGTTLKMTSKAWKQSPFLRFICDPFSYPQKRNENKNWYSIAKNQILKSSHLGIFHE